MSDLPVTAPAVTVETRRFWEAAGAGRLELPRCRACSLVVWYPRAICPDCWSTDLAWETMSGHGTVYSFTVTRSGGSRRWRDHLPFVVAYVRLDEGPTMLTNIVDCDPDDVAIDMAVTAVFDPVTADDLTAALVRFRPR